MILTKIYEHKDFIKKHSKKLRLILLILTPFFIIPKTSKNNILSDESLNMRDGTTEQICFKNTVLFSTFKGCEEFDLNKDSPYETILIIGKLNEKKNFLKIALLVSSSNYLAKNIKIRLFNDKVVCDSSEQYFCVIKLEFGIDNFVKAFPLRNRQPNSDLFYNAAHFYTLKTFFSFEFFTKYPNNINIIEMQIEPSILGTKKFYNFVCSISNFHSHSLGNYYYIPFTKYNVSWNDILPFLVLNVAYSGLTGFFNENTRFKTKYLYALIFFVSPWFFIFFIFSDYLFSFVCLVFICVINFKVAYFYSIILFLKHIFTF